MVIYGNFHSEFTTSWFAYKFPSSPEERIYVPTGARTETRAHALGKGHRHLTECSNHSRARLAPAARALAQKHRGAHVDAVEDLDLRAAEGQGAAVRAAQYVREDPVPKLAVQVQIEPAADARRRGLHEHHRQGRVRPVHAMRDAERGSSGREGMLQRLQGARGAGERPYRVNSVRCSPFPRATAAGPARANGWIAKCIFPREYSR